MGEDNIFEKIDEMSPARWEGYRDSHVEGSFTLLDVRQPKEYDKTHLPGAKLIPLPDLENRYQDISEHKPVVAYCASGVRSRAAAKFLTGRGFKVSSLKGGIKAWDGPEALGPWDWGLELAEGRETPATMLAVALGLERSLREFYEEMAEGPLEQLVASLFKRLAEFELMHEERIKSLFEQAAPGPDDVRAMERALNRDYAEGGFTAGQLREMFSANKLGLTEILDMAMNLEAQGLDLYLRLAQKSGRKETKDALWQIGQDEKQHLKALGELRETM